MKTNYAKRNSLMIIIALILVASIIDPIHAQLIGEQIVTKDKEVKYAVPFYEKGDNSKALAILEGIITKDQKNADAHYAQAVILSKMNKIDNAVDEAKKALELNSNNADYHYTLARLYLIQMGSANIFRKVSLSSSMKDELIASLKIDPSHKLAIINLGNFYYQAPSIAGGDINKAIELANRLITLDEKQGRILLCQINCSSNNYPKGIEEADKLIKLDEYTGRILRIQIFKKQGNSAKAEIEYKSIESKFGNNPDYYAFFNDYGYFLLNQKRIDEAIEKFKKQVSLAPKVANAYDSLGEAYFVKGMLKESLVEYKKALELNPNSKSAKDKIKEIKGKLAK